MVHVTCRLTDKNRDQLRPEPYARYGLPLPFYGPDHGKQTNTENNRRLWAEFRSMGVGLGLELGLLLHMIDMIYRLHPYIYMSVV